MAKYMDKKDLVLIVHNACHVLRDRDVQYKRVHAEAGRRKIPLCVVITNVYGSNVIDSLKMEILRALPTDTPILLVNSVNFIVCADMGQGADLVRLPPLGLSELASFITNVVGSSFARTNAQSA